VGAAVAELHHAGVEHADLNAHNLLLDAKGAVSVIDFDRGRLHAPDGAGTPGVWVNRNLGRLQRSLAKISRGLPAGRYSARDWEWFMAGYQAVAGREAA
jgi:3-deoxy-D-manno-octulosonic acid kinase